MGQKVNPILFRSGSRKEVSPSFFLSPPQTPHLSHLLVQEIECKKFVFSLLRSRGIVPRFCSFHRYPEKLTLDLDLYFSSLFLKESKLPWIRSFFKNMKEKYTRLRKVKDLKGFLDTSQDLENGLEEEDFFFEKKKALSRVGKRNKNFYQKVRKFHDFDVVYKRRLFYFLLYQKRKNVIEHKKEKEVIFSASQNHVKLGSPLVRMNLSKFTKLFGLRKLKYNFSKLFLNNFTFSNKTGSQKLLELNKFLCQSIQHYSGMEEVQIRLFSTQLLLLPSFKFYKRFLIRELSSFQRSRDLKNSFHETVELFYFIFRSFGKGNAFLLAKFISYMLEKNRKQMFLVKFFKKCVKVFFQKLPKSFSAIEGIRILIKGRFNKRRRTKKVVIQEGQISLQTLETSVDYSQTQAITIYGTFGVKVWISKQEKIL